jgi:hypothetical protein
MRPSKVVAKALRAGFQRFIPVEASHPAVRALARHADLLGDMRHGHVLLADRLDQQDGDHESSDERCGEPRRPPVRGGGISTASEVFVTVNDRHQCPGPGTTSWGRPGVFASLQLSTAQMSVVLPVRLRRVNWNVARSTAMSSRPTTSVVEGPAGLSVGK